MTTTTSLTETVTSLSVKPAPSKWDLFSDGIPPHIRKNQELAQDVFYTLVTPLNISLLLVLCTVLYLRFRSAPAIELPEGPSATVFRTFTPRTLLHNNGANNGPVYLAVKGKVYDVSSGRNFYGPGGMYENFAGRDATRGLACQSFDEEMLTKDLDGPLDPCQDLTSEQLENLQGWVERFDEKYLVVGKLVAFHKTHFH